jgi:hypothetical protein
MAKVDTKYIPRIGCEVSSELHAKVQKLIPHGYQKQIITTLLEQVVDLIETIGPKNAPYIIGAIVAGKITLLDIVRRMDDGK